MCGEFKFELIRISHNNQLIMTGHNNSHKNIQKGIDLLNTVPKNMISNSYKQFGQT